MLPAIRLRQEHLDQMIAQARAEAPNECCGVVAVRDGQVVALYAARNADQSPLRFTIDPMETKRIEEQIDASGARLGGFYHSHVQSAPRPSETDIRSMGPFFGPPYLHFVISLSDWERPVVRSYHIHADRYQEQPYRLLHSPSLDIRGRTFAWGTRTYVMGIINATPDSFSGDGINGHADRAAVLARRFEAEGADIIDVGAESTRPGGAPVDEAEELRRLLAVFDAVRAATDLPVSIDTYRASTAAAALDRGADLVNDVRGLRHDPALAPLIARRGVPAVIMHNQRGRPVRDVAADIRTGFEVSLAIAREAGIPGEHLILDPGFGFGWKPEQNLEMLRRLPELWNLGHPLLVGPSRKSTIGYVLGLPADERTEGTAAAVDAAIAGGADFIRVHDVREIARVARMSDAIWRGTWRHRPEIVIALGSNLGDRAANLRAAVEALPAEGIAVTRTSSVWETAPVPADQPPFLNAVVTGETELDPAATLRALKRIEHRAGRRPNRHWGPRPLDLDLLFHGDTCVDTADLQVPHPRVAERGFVLAPLSEVWRGPLPVLGATPLELLDATGIEGLTRTAARLR